MEQVTKKINCGGGLIKYKTILTSPECEYGSEEYVRFRRFMLEQFINNWSLAACGPSYFEKMVMYHTGNNWQLELELEVQEEQ